MLWSADLPMHDDARLAPHLGAAQALCRQVLPGAQVVRVLRHVAQRRVALLLEHEDALVVCKIFASPRARGNHRRLRALGATPARSVVPHVRAVDPTGHVLLVAHVPGSVLDECGDEQFVRAAHPAGAALRVLHDSGAVLDREWTIDDELAQLERRAPVATDAQVAQVCERVRSDGSGRSELVSAHRDCHPKQLVIGPEGAVCWIDLDDAAMAPRGLDIGNFVAHLRRDAVVGARPREVAAAAIAGFLTGYGMVPDDIAQWVELSTLRLAGLATTRHGRPDWTDLLAAAVIR